VNAALAESLAQLVTLIDAELDANVVVFGTPPPEGHDLDLLAQPREHALIAGLLERAHFENEGVRWCTQANGSSLCVELVPAAELGLPRTEEDALFAAAESLPGARHVARPSPHHELLLCARHLARSGEGLDERRRRRVAQALARDPDGWRRAADHAPAWRVRAGLALLRDEHIGGPGRPLRRTLARSEQVMSVVLSGDAVKVLARRRRRRKGVVIVAFSGLDGAGKSLQATRLQEHLATDGVGATIAWPPGVNPLYQLSPAIKDPVRRVLAALDRRPRPSHAVAPQLPFDPDEPRFERLPAMPRPLRHILATTAAFGQLISLRRSTSGPRVQDRVVIFDRYVLDSAIYVEHRWGGERPLPFERRLIEALVRVPDASFFLEVPAETAFARKRDYPLDVLRERAELYRAYAPALGVRRLDGTRPPDELAREIAATVRDRLVNRAGGHGG
jgi:thymidylate kinase